MPPHDHTPDHLLRPFRTRNRITATLLLSAIGLTYWYSIRAVKQEDFSDVKPKYPSAPSPSS
eukprot:m.279608 g.279608  ORF g.279608 m.279608 type:complete len:62 (-) comp54907_c0_seq1:202-387(-)